MLLTIVSIVPILLALQDAASPSVLAKPNTETRIASIAGEPAVIARLWVVVFDTTVPGDALPIDPRRAGQIFSNAGIPPQESNGRVQTTGLAVQEEIGNLDIRALGHRLFIKNGVLTTESTKPSDAKAEGKPPWSIIAAPAIQVLLKQAAAIKVGQPVVYLEKRADGLFESRTTAENVEGVSIELTASKILPKGIRFTGVQAKVHRIADREPVEGLALPVGKPRIETRETSLDITLDDGRVAIIPLPQGEHEPAILIFLSAQRVDAAR